MSRHQCGRARGPQWKTRVSLVFGRAQGEQGVRRQSYGSRIIGMLGGLRGQRWALCVWRMLFWSPFKRDL